MARIERFEDIKSWQKARELNKQIYAITSQGEFAKDFALKDQLRRASISIMLNIAEGFARHTHKEFIQFLYVAHGSASEVQSALYICCIYSADKVTVTYWIKLSFKLLKSALI